MSPYQTGITAVVGASGGIGAALVGELVARSDCQHVFAISRSEMHAQQDKVTGISVDDYDEESIQACLSQIHQQAGQLHTLICCIGTLHDRQASIRPEKRLEDISAQQLQHYFQVNTVIPGLWLKHAVSFFSTDMPARLIVLSARVGSISDNRVGGWYGYRASKAALNMLVKTAQVEYQRRAKNVALLAYHPGTVDTELSKPFQRNVKPEKLFTAQFTAQQLLSQLPELEPEAGPYYRDWQGKSIEW